jgi:hypothetical protein
VIRWSVVSLFSVLIASTGIAGPLDPPDPPAPTSLPGVRSSTPITAIPVTIEESGVYHLIGNFSVTEGHASAITVRADDVVIDLGGFTLTGPGIGTGRGVSGEDVAGVTVRNGSILDFGNAGIVLNAQSLVEDVRIVNTFIGISLGEVSCVRRAHISDCEFAGMQVFFGCEVIDTVVANCRLAGIGALFATGITGCTVQSTEGIGIAAIGPTVVRDCTVIGAQSSSFRGTQGAVFENCSAYLTEAGFRVEDGVAVRNCTARVCSVEGIAVESSGGGSSSVITDNVVDVAPIGIRVDEPSLVARNHVNFNTVASIQVGSPDVIVMDNTLTVATLAISDIGPGTNCLYIRNTGTAGMSFGAGSTFGPVVTGVNDLSNDVEGENPWANITH